jgi:hypothetical protein
MTSGNMRTLICRNEAEIVRLHTRVHDTARSRGESAERHAEWELACAEFHARYDALAFPGGYKGALDRIVAGDPDAMEAAVCFLECRPYFFRSGYMFKTILRRCRRAPLPEDLAIRLRTVADKLAAWRQQSSR